MANHTRGYESTEIDLVNITFVAITPSLLLHEPILK